jgi:hypothetical protein
MVLHNFARRIIRKTAFVVFILLILYFASICLIVLGFLLLDSTEIGCPDSWSRVRAGMRESQIARDLGAPEVVCGPAARKKECYYAVRGYTTPRTEPDSKAFVYFACNKALFIYINSAGTVSHRFVGIEK